MQLFPSRRVRVISAQQAAGGQPAATAVDVQVCEQAMIMSFSQEMASRIYSDHEVPVQKASFLHANDTHCQIHANVHANTYYLTSPI